MGEVIEGRALEDHDAAQQEGMENASDYPEGLRRGDLCYLCEIGHRVIEHWRKGYRVWLCDHCQEYARAAFRQANVQNARCKALGVQGTIDGSQIEFIAAVVVRCLCGARLSDGYEIDHVQPISKGGLNVIDNIQLLCRRCNRRKKDKWNGPPALV